MIAVDGQVRAESAPSILLGDPVPWFTARTVTGETVDLHVDAGRWVVLAFLGSLAVPAAAAELAELLKQAQLFDESRLVAHCVVTEPFADISVLASISGPALSFVADYDSTISTAYGAAGSPRTIVLDPMLRAVANIAWDDPGGHTVMLRALLNSLPDIDDSAGVPLSAPVLIVPRVLEFPLCDLLVQLYETIGGTESGFLLDRDGKTVTVIDHRLKRRHDMVIADLQMRETLRDRLVRRLAPAIERFFQFRPTRIDRYMVSCYDSLHGGHFFRHRDNVNAGAQHRRFAVTINLNRDYEGCDLVFPEFGRRTYRAPEGGAIVFSCGMLHEVTPVARGKRYALVPFLYGEDDADLREDNNAHLGDGEAHYIGGRDLLYPVTTQAERRD